MAVSTAADLNTKILALSPSTSKPSAVQAFVDVIATFTQDVQAGSMGSPGVLTLNKPAMVGILTSQSPTAGNDWIMTMANAWEAGVSTGTVAVGTVTNPAWIGSGGMDISCNISNVAAAKSMLISELASVVPDSSAALPMATAFRNATLALKFLCVGLGPPPSMAPIPLTFNAE